MAKFKITAQAYVGNTRITKTFEAASENEALRLASKEAEGAGFYVIGIFAM